VEGIVRAWGKILAGYRPNLSIEITRECPLRCPGCYAYGDDHLNNGVTLRELSDKKGQPLIDGVMALIDRHKPLHLSIVGGEPLVRYRELNEILPKLAERGVYTQLVTSAVRPIPSEWIGLRRLQIVVSIDGLQPEHDERRKPATYDRILKHIVGHNITVHCTVTRQQARRPGYLEEFVKFWSDNKDTGQIWVSLYTPQIGEISVERLTKEDRTAIVASLLDLRTRYPKVGMPKGLIDAYANPPQSPEECIFAKTTECVSADFTTPITPCQFGGKPDCAQCGCIASAGLKAVARHKLRGGIRVGAIFDASLAVGDRVRAVRERFMPPAPPAPPVRATDSAA
jgi:sulfatase maturation enzyme AslB (radical SAM superfamily)